jgi:hypothetical protein
MLESELISRIRDIFLHQRPHVSISTATALLGWSRQQMSTAIAAGEIDLMTTPLGKWIWREEVVAKALELWPPEIIEEALGAEAASVLPEARRLADLHARIPRYQIAMLTYFAEQHQTTIGDVLARELEDVASANAEELSAAFPGFGAALGWPNQEDAQLPC